MEPISRHILNPAWVWVGRKLGRAGDQSAAATQTWALAAQDSDDERSRLGLARGSAPIRSHWQNGCDQLSISRPSDHAHPASDGAPPRFSPTLPLAWYKMAAGGFACPHLQRAGQYAERYRRREFHPALRLRSQQQLHLHHRQSRPPSQRRTQSGGTGNVRPRPIGSTSHGYK